MKTLIVAAMLAAFTAAVILPAAIGSDTAYAAAKKKPTSMEKPASMEKAKKKKPTGKM